MTNPDIRRWDDETRLVAGLAACASLIAFTIYLGRGQILLYGDAVAHINIARRVFDSRTPGLLQLGTVWLPLPHLLMIPFLLSHWAWQRGGGGWGCFFFFFYFFFVLGRVVFFGGGGGGGGVVGVAGGGARGAPRGVA